MTRITASSIAAAKAAMRHDARTRRDAIDGATRVAADHAITDRADAELLAPLPPGALVALYDAIGSEVATRALAARAIDRGLVLAYPRIVRGELALTFHRVSPAELTAGALGILEPPHATPDVRPADIALAILPGLAFDRQGARLGWGRGHYDATLATVPDLARAGLAYESQLVDRLPTDAHDLFVHRIVTEVAVHRGA